MCLSPNPIQPRRQQQGSALVIAIFVIVMMSFLAVALLRMGNNADEDVNLEVWSLRAFAAANSGADAALAQLFPLNGSVATCASSSIWTPPDKPGFHGCSVSLSCVSQTANDVTQYIVRSTAVCETGDCSSGDSEQCLRVSRSVEVEARE
ncbi:MSHA biogenesis protein MshP [Shewanella dokdonensis]|uniref:MSHA biogenesis protein MshP n=1 Tax=Shewanella dokdonensis TaxID=712036 RepID=A0ABX8DB05_9GAMM|nr:MSHA biogenesis protein MshP [Shewanella dokdonensis]MCL1075325.1 MSHA biogenesis protein MshP [Shewanella dokdonensis]QVK22037.1 MSHA biogenesis protein MshP [Shewanella dokdonensis]